MFSLFGERISRVRPTFREFARRSGERETLTDANEAFQFYSFIIIVFLFLSFIDFLNDSREKFLFEISILCYEQ